MLRAELAWTYFCKKWAFEWSRRSNNLCPLITQHSHLLHKNDALILGWWVAQSLAESDLIRNVFMFQQSSTADQTWLRHADLKMIGQTSITWWHNSILQPPDSTLWTLSSILAITFRIKKNNLHRRVHVCPLCSEGCGMVHDCAAHLTFVQESVCPSSVHFSVSDLF